MLTADGFPVTGTYPDGTPVVRNPHMIGAVTSLEFTFDRDWATDLVRALALMESQRTAPSVVRIPYIPCAREDKAGGPMTLRVVADMVNRISRNGEARVETLDPHSDVAPMLIRNCRAEDVSWYIAKAVTASGDVSGTLSPTLLFPDATAAKRYGRMFPNYRQYMAVKHRDDRTHVAHVDSVTLLNEGDSDHGAEALFVVDDIVTKGGSVKKAYDAYVAVCGRPAHTFVYATHLEVAALFAGSAIGDMVSAGEVERVYTTPSIARPPTEMPVTEIPFKWRRGQ